MKRFIIHVDMDAFFASVEQRDNSALKGKPVAVGGRPENRGVVAAASYEARKFGVRSAMAMGLALQKCPDLVIVPPDHEKYRLLSETIMGILYRYTPLVEQISIDEAFLDVSGSLGLFGSVEDIGRKIQETILAETGLTASVGIGPNKFVAKLASDYGKPHGFTVVTNEEMQQFLDPLPVSRLWGVGEKTAKILKGIGLLCVKDVKRLSLEHLEGLLGKQGRQIFFLSRGIDERPVISEYTAKSIGKETTFSQDISDTGFLLSVANRLVEDVGLRLRKTEKQCRTVNLKLRFDDWETITRSYTLKNPTDLTGEIYKNISRLLRKEFPLKKAVRLIGISVSHLCPGMTQQLLLFDHKAEKEAEIAKITDALKGKYGKNVVQRGRALLSWNSNRKEFD